MERLGLTVGLEAASLQESLELCRRAEELGYTDVWSAEVGGADGAAPLAALAATTSKVRLGTAILPVFTRPPALVAMSAATLQQLCGGRFVLGLGTSSSIIVEAWMGGSFRRPVTRLREYVSIVRAALAGEKVALDGTTTRINGYRLQLPPVEVPIYVAALGPAACRLAGEIADGIIFFLKTPEGVKQGLEWMAEGASAAGRDPNELDCVIRLPLLDASDGSDVSAGARRAVVSYAIVDVYNRSLRQQGFGTEADAIASAWSAGDRKGAAQAVTEEMYRGLLLIGDADTCKAQLQAFRAAGVKTPVLLPLGASAESARKTIEALAP